jgi:hypothetical protein
MIKTKDAQNGCGHRFLWRDAPQYQPRLNSRNSPSLAIQSPEIATIDNGPYACGILLFLPFSQAFYVLCFADFSGLRMTLIDICEDTIKGLRFSCLHCKMYDVCEECEAQGLAIHDNHIFKIINLQN